jgi:hypothetical protein
MVAEATFLPIAPSIDTAEARWAADELSGLLNRVDDDSVAAMILRQAQRELYSLVPGGQPAAEVVGPFRLRIAA